MADKKTFLYQADAVAFGGKITLPFHEVLEGQATCALSIHGGYSQAHVENYRFKNFFSFGSARSQAIGNYSEADKAYFSMASVCIEKINVMDMITCDRIISRVSAMYPNQENPSEVQITPLGCSFENLRIDGKPIHVQLATSFFNQYPTFSSLITDRGMEALSSLSLGQNKGQLTSYSMVSNDADFGFKDHVLEIPQFGSVRLARLFCSYNVRRVSMLEVTLGCPGEGEGNFGGAAGGGNPWP